MDFFAKHSGPVLLDLKLGGRSITLEIRRRKGARHLRLSLDHRNWAIVSAPARCSQRTILEFVDSRRDWLLEQLALLPESCSLTEWLQHSPRISGSGDVFSVRIESQPDRRRADYRFAAGGSELLLQLPAEAEDAEAQLLKLVRRFAKDALTCRVAYHAKRLGLSFKQVSVRDQSSRWGSCSSNDSISLNWRLVLMEPVLQDYVILHELAHLTQMNHSARFWALLESYDPQRVQHEAQLDACTPELMRVGRSN